MFLPHPKMMQTFLKTSLFFNLLFASVPNPQQTENSIANEKDYLLKVEEKIELIGEKIELIGKKWLFLDVSIPMASNDGKKEIIQILKKLESFANFLDHLKKVMEDLISEYYHNLIAFDTFQKCNNSFFKIADDYIARLESQIIEINNILERINPTLLKSTPKY
jgi:hypothetical protein